MMKVIRYCPTENGGEPQIFRIPPRKTTYRVDIYVKKVGKKFGQLRHIPFRDKVPISEPHALALRVLKKLTPPSAEIEAAYFELWAECGR